MRKVRDFAAFVRQSEPGVNLRLMRGGGLRGPYTHSAMVKEWCALGDTARGR